MGKETEAKGNASELFIAAEFVRIGIPTLKLIVGNESYDLVVEIAGKFYKIQCKTGQYIDGKVIFRGYSNTFGNNKQIVAKRYGSSVDFFGVYNSQIKKVYLIPASEVGWDCRLRVEPCKNNQKKSTKLASDYILEDVVNKLKTKTSP